MSYPAAIFCKKFRIQSSSYPDILRIVGDYPPVFLEEVGDDFYCIHHPDSEDVGNDFTDQLREMCDRLQESGGLASPFKITIRNVETGTDDNEEHVYGGPDSQSIARFKYHEKVDAIEQAIADLATFADTPARSDALKGLTSAVDVVRNADLQPYVVTYRYPGENHGLLFECQAEDPDHAREQALNAYDDAIIESVQLCSAQSENNLKSYFSQKAAPTESDGAVSIELLMRVDFQLNGADPQDLQNSLRQIANAAIENGAVTGESAASVANYEVNVTEFSPGLEEEVVANFISRQIEDGNFKLEDMSLRAARYGLQSPAMFIAEMTERMELAQADAEDDAGTAAPGPSA